MGFLQLGQGEKNGEPERLPRIGGLLGGQKALALQPQQKGVSLF